VIYFATHSRKGEYMCDKENVIGGCDCTDEYAKYNTICGEWVKNINGKYIWIPQGELTYIPEKWTPIDHSGYVDGIRYVETIPIDWEKKYNELKKDYDKLKELFIKECLKK
jgi:hypothetical protein